jgi:hypothetical protein
MSGLEPGVVKLVAMTASFFCLLLEDGVAASSNSITSRLLDVGAISGDATDSVVEEGGEYGGETGGTKREGDWEVRPNGCVIFDGVGRRKLFARDTCWW